ncbi:MAG: hypothetical protein ABIH86_03590 [Planctomycetota bacterium]
MARKRAGALSINLDSLLDTLFNVVGMLIIILALVVLNVSESVSIIKFVEKQRAAVKIESFYERYNELLTADPLPGVEPLSLTAVSTESLEDRLKALEDRLAYRKETLDEYDRLSESLSKEIVRRENKDNELKQNSRVLRIPVMRDADPSKKSFIFVCINERVYPLDMDSLAERFEAMLPRVRTGEGWAEVEAFLRKNPFGDEHFRLLIQQKFLVFVPNDTGGWDTSDPRFGAMLDALLKRLPQNEWVLTFRVCDDSFSNYLDIRSLVDEKGYESGWTPHTLPFYISVSLEPASTGGQPDGPIID